jgi:hypothetical protein
MLYLYVINYLNYSEFKCVRTVATTEVKMMHVFSSKTCFTCILNTLKIEIYSIMQLFLAVFCVVLI